MIVDNVRLPVDVERGVRGGPMFSTIVNMTDGGSVSTNQNWSYPLYKGNVGYGIQSRENMEDVLSFFYARRGRLRGFLFKDWSDYEFTAEELGTGDGAETDFQVVRTYTDTTLPFTRILTRPIESTMVVYADGTPVSDANWSLLSTGEVRFSVAPSIGVVITATGEFNIPARFMTDHLEMEMEIWSAGSIPSIPIMEVRE